MNITPIHALANSVYREYQSRFNDTPMLVRSPGRINLIGEHTDYNQGWVLPAAIDKNVVAAVGKRHDSAIHLYAIDPGRAHVVKLEALERSPLHWPNYILGVVQQLVNTHRNIQGFNL